MAYSHEKNQKGGQGMNVKLRKRHRYIWMSFGILLPLLCLQAIENIPANPLKEIPRHACLLDIGVCGIDSEEFPIEITQSAQEDFISINLTSPLKSAFTIAYLSNDQVFNESAEALGAINSMGKYQFAYSGKPKQYLLLYDQLKKVTIYHQKLEVKP